MGSNTKNMFITRSLHVMRVQFLLPYITNCGKLLLLREDIWTEFYTMDAMMNRQRMEPNQKKCHTITILVVHKLSSTRRHLCVVHHVPETL